MKDNDMDLALLMLLLIAILVMLVGCGTDGPRINTRYASAEYVAPLLDAEIASAGVEKWFNESGWTDHVGISIATQDMTQIGCKHPSDGVKVYGCATSKWQMIISEETPHKCATMFHEFCHIGSGRFRNDMDPTHTVVAECYTKAAYEWCEGHGTK